MKFSKSKSESKFSKSNFESQFSKSEYVTKEALSIYFAQTRIRITDSVVEFVVKFQLLNREEPGTGEK